MKKYFTIENFVWFCVTQIVITLPLCSVGFLCLTCTEDYHLFFAIMSFAIAFALNLVVIFAFMDPED